MRSPRMALGVAAVFFGSVLSAQGPAAPSSGTNGKLAYILPNMFGGGGLVLPNQTHMAHFDSAFRESFGPFNAALASQLTSLPIPSPASGFTYTFDKELGVAKRSAQSFGPILAERAETIGKDKFSFGIAQQFFRFDSIDGINLSHVPAVFQHAPSTNIEFAKDIITTQNFVDIRIGQITPYFSYGLTDRLDISVAIPFVRASLSANAKAQVQRIGTGTDQSVHYFETPDHTTSQFTGAGEKSGLGDAVVRLKGTVLRASHVAVAAGTDFRAPIGDEYDFLGTGAAGVRPFLAASVRAKNFSPHVNLSYQWNGKSVLAGNIVTGERAKLPNEIGYIAGADIGLTRKFTVSGDLIGLRRPNAQRVVSNPFMAANGQRYDNIAFRRAGLVQNSAALGFKINGVGNLLLAFNVLFRLDDAGLKGRIVPLISASYMF